MGKYDKIRAAVNGTSINTEETTTPKKSKYDKIRSAMGLIEGDQPTASQPVQTVQNTQPSRPAQPSLEQHIAEGKVPGFNIMETPLMKKINSQPAKTSPPEKAKTTSKKSKGGIPVLDFLNEKLGGVVEGVSNLGNRAAVNAVNELSLGQGKRVIQNDTSAIGNIFKENAAPADTKLEKAADIFGSLYGFAAPTAAAYGTGGKLFANALKEWAPNAPNIVKNLVRGAGAGLTYSSAKEGLDALVGPERKTPEERLKNILLDTALFAGGDAALSAVGKGVKAMSQHAKNTATGLSENAIKNVADNSRFIKSPFSEGAAASNKIANNYTKVVGSTFNKGGSAPKPPTPKAAPPQAAAADNLITQPVLQSGKGLVEQANRAAAPKGPTGPISKSEIEDLLRSIDEEVQGGTNPPTPPPVSNAPKPPSPQGIRANYKNQLDNGNFSDELQAGIRNTDQTYDIARNVESVAKANENVKNLNAAADRFLLNESGGADHVATGYRLMQELDALGEHGRALVVSKKLAEDLTKSGQTSQAASILSRLSPEGQLLNLVRTAERNGKEVSVADSIKFKDLAAKVQEKSGAGIRANQFNEILGRLERGENVGVDDIKKLSDYLSGSEKVIKPKAKPVKDELPKEFSDTRKRDRIVSYLDEAEQAALARIAARKNNLNSLPINEWADHGIVVAAQIAKGAIKAATHVEDMVKLFGEDIRPYATEVFQKAQGVIKGVSGSAAEGNLQKANEAFSRISGVKKETPLQEKIVEKYLRENDKVSQKDIDTLRELAKDVTRLSGDQKLDADIAMQKILNSYEKSSIWDKVLALRYMGMLLNSATQLINAASGPIMASTGVVADVFGTMLDVAMSSILKSPRTTTLYGTNPLKFTARYYKNLKTGAKAGFQGVNPAGIQGTNEIRGLAFKSVKNPLTFVPAMGERVLGAVAKGPDFATYKSVYDSEMIKQGFLDAKNSGVKGKQNIQNHIEQFINNPPEEAILQADRIGKNTTFQRADRSGGIAANWLNNAPKGVKPFVNTIFPFVRTPVNIASTAVTLTPAGLIKGLYQLTSKADASRREAIRTLSLGLTGTGGLSATGYYLEQLGIITGANDSGDKDADAIREQAGKGKYRFNTSALKRYLGAMLSGEGSEAAEKAAQYRKGDKQFDYNKLQPLAFPVAIGASLSENKDKPVLKRLAKAGEDAYGSLFGMSTLKGVQDVFQPQYGGTMGEKALGTPARIAESFFKSFSSGGLAQEARRQDPIQRKVPYNDGIIADTTAYFKSRTPGISKSLPPNKTTLGQTKMNAEGIKGQYLNPYKSEVAPFNEAAAIISDLIDRTGDKTLAPSAPPKSVSGKSRTDGKSMTVSIPPDRYAKLQEDVGQQIIEKIMAMPDTLTDDRKSLRIKEIYKMVKERETKKLKREFGIIAAN